MKRLPEIQAVPIKSKANNNKLSEYAGLVRAGCLPDRRLPEALERFVSLHLGRHLSRLAGSIHCPRYAVIDGPPGGGKTSTVEYAVTKKGCHLLRRPAAGLSGETEDGAVKVFLEDERILREISERTGEPVAYVLEDLDRSILGRRAETQYCVSSQLLEVEAMTVADDRSRFTTSDGRTIPIFVTVNTTTVFEDALFRPGRAVHHTHVLSADETACIVAEMLGLTASEADQLVALAPDQPLSFFAGLKAEAIDDGLEELMLRHGSDWDAIGALAAKLPDQINKVDLWMKARASGTTVIGGDYSRMGAVR